MGNQNKVVVKKQGFSLLSFFLGILLGIILVLGSVVGVAYRALTYDLDKVLDAAGVKNKDENGDNIYINTDTDEGGVKNMLELISRISSLASNSKDLTLGQIDALIPAAGGLIKQIVNSMNEYVEIDVEELSGVRFSEFSAYFTELVLDIRPGAIVGKMGTGELNSLVKLLLYGVECRYVTDEGVKYPLYYDVFTMNGTLEREDGVKLPVSEEYAYEEPDGIHFGVYIYSVGDGWYVAEKTDEGFIPTGLVYSVYSEEYAMATGNYYKDGEETVYNDPITIRSLIGTDGMGALGKVLLADLIGEMSGENNMMIVEKILGGITLNDLLNGNIDIESTIHNIKIGDIVPANGNKILETLGDYTIGNLSEAMDELKIGSLIDIPADNALLVYLGYGVTGVELPEDGEIPDGEYSAKFNIDDETYKEAKVVVEGGIVISAYYIEGGETRYLGTTLNEISGRIDDLTKNVPIGDIIDVGDSALLKKLAKYTLGNISEAIDSIVVSDFVDITSDSAILAYLAYGITELNVENNTAYLGETEVYLEIVEKDGKQVIAGVYYDKDYTEPLPGTNINGINSRLEGFTHDVKIKDLLGEEKIKNNTILEKLGDYTIDGVADAINDFEVAEIVNIKPDDAVMMLYLAFGVTSVSEENGVYTARKGDLTVYFKTRVDDNGETYLDSIYSDAELSVRLDGTKINNVGAQISGLTKEVKLGELIKLEGKSPIIELIKDSTLENVGNVISDLTLPDVVKIPVNNIILAYIGYGITEVDKEAKTAVHNGQKVILTVDEDGNIVGVSENGVQLKGTKIDDIDDRINYLISDLTVGELLPELNDSNNKLVKRIAASKLNGIGEIVNNLTVVEVVDVPADNAIMAYLAYGITEVNVDENGKGTAMFGEEQVDLILTKTESEEDDKVNVTYYIVGVTRADGTELESTPINGINAKIADLTSVVKIKNIINIDENSSPVMRKLGEYTLDTVDEAISDITVADVMDVDADSAIMSYIAYGISKVDLNAGTAKLGDDSVYLDIGDGKIKGAYYDLQHDAPVPGTKINEINARITGLMNDLTIGELIKIPEGNAIMNAVKDSTINSLSDDIDNLTINELYADKIYVGKDEDGNELPAVMKKVVEGNADANNNEIEFDTAYLYYKLVSGEFGESSAVYKMVGEGETKGKLDEFTDGYYTYGMPSEIWQLLLVESSGGSSNEKAYSINDLTNMMDNISDNMERFNLRTLNNAGILKFTDSESLDKLIPDLSKLPGGYKNKHANIPLGELTIPQAIEAIVDLMYYINNLPASTP